jgi:hypothetical protein
MNSKSVLIRVFRICAAAILIWLAIQSLRGTWHAAEFALIFRKASVTWLVWSALAVAATYCATIESWRRMMKDEGVRLGTIEATRIVSAANLGKYLPGRVWGILGAGLFASQRGFPPGAAMRATLFQQIVTLATGMIVAGLLSPREPGSFGKGLAVAAIVVGACSLAMTAALLHEGARRAITLRVPRLARGIPQMKHSTWVIVVALSICVWSGLGAGLVLLERALFGSISLSWPTATGVFSASYILGFIALLAPAGIGPREAAFVLLLSSAGAPLHAAALALASRLVITVIDLGFALPFLGDLLRASRLERNARERASAG